MSQPTSDSEPAPDAKLCECGCGQPAPIATQTNKRRGDVRGEPVRFILGHAGRGRAASKRPCDICGEHIGARSTLGVCDRPGECRKEYNRRRHRRHNPEPVTSPCSICGGPLDTKNKSGVCWRTPECRREAGRISRAKDPASALERRRERYAAKAQVERERHRKWLQRPDRPCRYARAGCPESAVVGQHCCPEHDAAERSRRGKRRRARIRQTLAAAQGGICPWCELPFAADASDAEVDHIIPVSRGGPDEPWNLQLLHKRCNGAGGKGHRITAQALALAARYGIAIANAA